MWENLDAIKKREYSLNPQIEALYGELFPAGWGLLAGLTHHSVLFYRVPHTTTGRQGIKEWKVNHPSTLHQAITLAVYLPENLLVLVGFTFP